MEIRSKLALETETAEAAAFAATEAPAALAATEAEAKVKIKAKAAKAAPAATTATEATPLATLNVDLFQVLIGQIDKISKLLEFHETFPFLGKTCVVWRSRFPCAIFCDLSSMSRPHRKYSNPTE